MAKGIYVGVANSSLVANGDFENGLDGWSDGVSEYIDITQDPDGYSGNCMKSEVVLVDTASATAAVAFCSIPTIAGHIYYASVRIKGASSNYADMKANIYLRDSSQFTTGNYAVTNEATWQLVSSYGTANSTTTGQVRLPILKGNASMVTVGMALYYDNVRAFDLTALYGAGNEPTKEWCDSNASTLESLYKQKSGGVARKVKKAYVGVENTARKVKKGYIGVGGVARLFFSSEKELSYYGTATNLSAARQRMAATAVGNYALFGGGHHNDGNTYMANVDTYTSSLVKGEATQLSVKRYRLAAATVGNYALFGGGVYSNTYYATVDTYTSSLVKSTATDLSNKSADLAATAVGDYVLFAGGRASSSYYSDVDSYTSSIVKSTVADLSSSRYNFAATTVGDYALFAGGLRSSYYATVDTYTSSLVKSTATDLSEARSNLAATTVGDYALFAGGQSSSVGKTTVDSYTSALVKGTPAALSVQRTLLAATTVGGYALFGGGGRSTTGAYDATVDTYNTSLVKNTAKDLSVARQYLAATSVGDYALFAGGEIDSDTITATVDVYQAI